MRRVTCDDVETSTRRDGSTVRRCDGGTMRHDTTRRDLLAQTLAAPPSSPIASQAVSSKTFAVNQVKATTSSESYKFGLSLSLSPHFYTHAHAHAYTPTQHTPCLRHQLRAPRRWPTSCSMVDACQRTSACRAQAARHRASFPRRAAAM